MSTPRSGLGRGLASLLPTAETAPQPDLGRDEQILHALATRGLDQISSAADADLLAYAHVPHHDDATDILRSPSLDSLTATRAFRLFSRFDRAIASGATEDSFSFEGLIVVFLRTTGSHTSGVHFVGRKGAVFDGRSLARIRASTRSFGTICNQHSEGTPDDLPGLRLVVDITDAGTSVAVTYTDQLGQERSGRGMGDDASSAVVRAVLEATGSSLTYTSARENPINGTNAVLVVLSDERGIPHPGFVVTDDELLQATAIATLRAIQGR